MDIILQTILTLYLGLAGFAAIIAFLINLGKRVGWVKDGMAEKWSQWLNFVGLVVVGVLYFVAPTAIPYVDSILGALANLGGVLFPVLALIFGWPIAVGVSSFTHNKTRGFPIFGFSHSK